MGSMRFELRLTLKKIRTIGLWLLAVVIGAGGGYFYGTHKIEIELENVKPTVTIYNRGVPEEHKNVDFSYEIM